MANAISTKSLIREINLNHYKKFAVLADQEFAPNLL
jgi:hypothetical protein